MRSACRFTALLRQLAQDDGVKSEAEDKEDCNGTTGR